MPQFHKYRKHIHYLSLVNRIFFKETLINDHYYNITPYFHQYQLLALIVRLLPTYLKHVFKVIIKVYQLHCIKPFMMEFTSLFLLIYFRFFIPNTKSENNYPIFKLLVLFFKLNRML